MSGDRPVLLIGPGAIGSAVAAGLIDRGHRVVVAARTPFDRFDVRWPDGSIDVAAECVDTPDADLDPSVVVVAVKAHQSVDAGAWIRSGSAHGAPVYVLQNGVEQVATVEPLVTPGAPVVPTVVQLPASRTAPGRVDVTGRAALTVPARDGVDDELADLLAGSFVRVKVVDDWTTPAWIKLMMNAALGGVGALTQRDNRVFDDPDAHDLAVGLMEEVAAVGRAEGAQIPDSLPGEMVGRVRAAASGHASSIVVDRRNGVPTEWRVRNAAVGRVGRRHGIETPLNDLVTTLIRLGEPEPSTED